MWRIVDCWEDCWGHGGRTGSQMRSCMRRQIQDPFQQKRERWDGPIWATYWEEWKTHTLLAWLSLLSSNVAMSLLPQTGCKQILWRSWERTWRERNICMQWAWLTWVTLDCWWKERQIDGDGTDWSKIYARDCDSYVAPVAKLARWRDFHHHHHHVHVMIGFSSRYSF